MRGKVQNSECYTSHWNFAIVHCWISVYDGGSATLSLQDQISGVIFLRKVYKSLATRKKRGHSKTIKQSSNSPSKVINIKSSFKMIMPKISFFQITCRKWQQKVQFFLLLKGGKPRCCQVQCWAAAVSGHENVKDSSHFMCFIVLTQNICGFKRYWSKFKQAAH